MSEIKTQGPDHAKASKFILGSGLYDFLRKFVNFVLPALAVLYASLAGFWGFPKVVEVVGTIGALVIFLNVVLMISKKNYNADPDLGTDGDLSIMPGDEDGVVLKLKLDETDLTSLAGLVDKGSVTLRVSGPTPSQ